MFVGYQGLSGDVLLKSRGETKMTSGLILYMNF